MKNVMKILWMLALTMVLGLASCTNDDGAPEGEVHLPDGGVFGSAVEPDYKPLQIMPKPSSHHLQLATAVISCPVMPTGTPPCWKRFAT